MKIQVSLILALCGSAAVVAEYPNDCGQTDKETLLNMNISGSITGTDEFNDCKTFKEYSEWIDSNKLSHECGNALKEQMQSGYSDKYDGKILCEGISDKCTMKDIGNFETCGDQLPDEPPVSADTTEKCKLIHSLDKCLTGNGVSQGCVDEMTSITSKEINVKCDDGGSATLASSFGLITLLALGRFN